MSCIMKAVMLLSCMFLQLVGLSFASEVFHMYHVQEDNPGLKVRISQKGLQYAAREAISVLASDLNGKAIPDKCDDAHVPVIGKITYCISGMKIASFSSPSTSVTTSPFKWTVGNVGASIHGDWKYKNHGFIHVSDHGSFDISLSGWSMETVISMGVDSTGRPTATSTGCSCGVGSLHVKLHGGASWLYNLFKGKIADALKNVLKKQLCASVDKAINVNGAQKLATLKVSIAVDKVLSLDYRLTKSPEFTTSYLESSHKGEIFWTGQSENIPVAAPPLPEISTDKMVAIWLSEYVMNTLGYVEYKHNTLNYNFTDKDLPKEHAGALNTTCTSFICIGNIIPVLAQKFPNATVALGLSVNEAPSLDIAPTGLTGTFKGLISYYVVYPDKPTQFAFSTNSSVTFNLTAAIVGMNVTVNINDFEIGKLELFKSQVGKVIVAGLDVIIKTVVNEMKPKLQDLARRGVSLPNIKGIQYVSPRISLVQNAIVVLTDAKYVG